MMQIIDNENIEPFDVDGTLVMHQAIKSIPYSERVKVFDSVTSKYITMRINRPMVRLLQEASDRGFFILVWSKGGKRWASDVIRALQLTEDVDLVMTKPLHYFDDTPVEKWMPERVYIEPDVIYKQQPTREK